MRPGGAGRRRDARPDPDPLRCPRSCPADVRRGGGRALTLVQRSPCEATASRRGPLLGNDRPPPARGGGISARPPAERDGEASLSLAEPKRSVSRRRQAEAGTPAAGGRAAGPAPAPSPPAPPPGAGGGPAAASAGCRRCAAGGGTGRQKPRRPPGGAARGPPPAREGALPRAPGAPGGSAALRGAGGAPPAATRSRGSVSPSRGAGAVRQLLPAQAGAAERRAGGELAGFVGRGG